MGILVLPGLVLNYFDQGALILGNPEAVRNPFYLLAPGWALLPMVALSTFLSRETVIPVKRIGMARWRETLFAFLLKNANSNLKYFKLPLNRVIELGTQVEM